MSDKKKLERLFFDAYKKNDRSLASQAMQLNQALGKDGLTLEEIHELSFEIWDAWMAKWEKKYKELVMALFYLNPDGDSWGSMVIAGNWYGYHDYRESHMKKEVTDKFSQQMSRFIDALNKDEEKRFFRDIIPTPYM